MTSSADDLVRYATARLKLRDIRLSEANFLQPNALHDAKSEVKVNLFVKRAVSFNCFESASDNENVTIFQAVVELGIRVVAADSEDANASESVYAQIEATFMAEYSLTDDIPEDALQAFAELNGVHNVWPFWRQHVFDIVQRAGLPHIDVPLFAGNHVDHTRAKISEASEEAKVTN
jgi:preprotein translocase subunit SecB